MGSRFPGRCPGLELDRPFGACSANGGAVNGAIANNPGGVFNIGGPVASNSTFANAASATLNVNPTTAGTYTVTGALTNSGAILVGSMGTLTVAGGVTNNATGTITVATGGTVNDVLSNSGIVTNNGAYHADVVNTGFITSSATGTCCRLAIRTIR
jgi:fibronectin-binding autotransporter adhesin